MSYFFRIITIWILKNVVLLITYDFRLHLILLRVQDEWNFNTQDDNYSCEGQIVLFCYIIKNFKCYIFTKY